MITIHGVPVSVHARKAIATAILKGLDYTCVPVIPYAPPAGWGDLSPAGLIPVMEADGQILPDSTAICLYLDRIAPTPPLLPADARAYGRVLWLDAYAGVVFRTVIHGLFFQKVIGPLLLGHTTDQAAVAAILAGPRAKAFDYLETQTAGRYLVGQTLTLADLAIASNLINYLYLGLTIDPANHPNLAAYAARMVREPAIRKTLDAETPFTAQMNLDRTFLPEPEAA